MTKHQPGDLKQMQSLPLDSKIAMTKRRIREWYDAFDGNVYVSFSGGKDSTVLLHIARQIYPNIPAVFCDTGLEYPEIKEFVKSTANVTIIRPKMNFKQVIQTYGYPVISKEVAQNIYEARRNPQARAATKFDSESEYNRKYKGQYSLAKWRFLRDSAIPVGHQCCTVMKKSPFKTYEKETGAKGIVATMACESRTRKTDWLMYGCNAFNKTRPLSTPMSFWTEQDVLRYLKEYGIPYCPVYGEIAEDKDGRLYTTGTARTGCMFCMFGVHREKEPNRFQKMKETHPKIYEYCMRPIEENGLGLDKVLNFLGVPH